jgi:hypothetical protein
MDYYGVFSGGQQKRASYEVCRQFVQLWFFAIITEWLAMWHPQYSNNFTTNLYQYTNNIP